MTKELDATNFFDAAMGEVSGKILAAMPHKST